MTAKVKDQVFTNNTHQVVTNHADIVFRFVGADVGVDGGQTLGNSAGSFKSGFVDKQDFGVVVSPFFDLKCSTAGSHATADDQNINVSLLYLWLSNGFNFTSRFVR